VRCARRVPNIAIGYFVQILGRFADGKNKSGWAGSTRFLKTKTGWAGSTRIFGKKSLDQIDSVQILRSANRVDQLNPIVEQFMGFSRLNPICWKIQLTMSRLNVIYQPTNCIVPTQTECWKTKNTAINGPGQSLGFLPPKGKRKKGFLAYRVSRVGTIPTGCNVPSNLGRFACWDWSARGFQATHIAAAGPPKWIWAALTQIFTKE